MSKDERVEALKKGAIELERFALNFKFPSTPKPKGKKRFKRRR